MIDWREKEEEEGELSRGERISQYLYSRILDEEEAAIMAKGWQNRQHLPSPIFFDVRCCMCSLFKQEHNMVNHQLGVPVQE